MFCAWFPSRLEFGARPPGAPPWASCPPPEGGVAVRGRRSGDRVGGWFEEIWQLKHAVWAAGTRTGRFCPETETGPPRPRARRRHRVDRPGRHLLRPWSPRHCPSSRSPLGPDRPVARATVSPPPAAATKPPVRFPPPTSSELPVPKVLSCGRTDWIDPRTGRGGRRLQWRPL